MKERRQGRRKHVHILDLKCNSFYSEGSMQVGGFPFIFFIAIDIQFVCPYQLSGMYQLELCEGRVLSGELSLISRRA